MEQCMCNTARNTMNKKMYIQPTLSDTLQQKNICLALSTVGQDCKVADNVDDITWLLPRGQLMGHHTKLFSPPAKLLVVLSSADTFTFYLVFTHHVQLRFLSHF